MASASPYLSSRPVIITAPSIRPFSSTANKVVFAQLKADYTLRNMVPKENRTGYKPQFDETTPISALLARNAAWASRQAEENPGMLESLAHSQSPKILWIGCSDSRVPETTILDLLPGDLFVHRNIANVVSAGDLSVLSVLQFAVEVLKVKHIIVCGTIESFPLLI